MKPAEDIFRKCGKGNFTKGVNRLSAWTGIRESQIVHRLRLVKRLTGEPEDAA